MPCPSLALALALAPAAGPVAAPTSAVAAPRPAAVTRSTAAVVGPVVAANVATPASAEDRFNRRRIVTQQAGMGVLTGWAIANIGVGAVGSFTAGGVWRHVHEMNALWNTVNLTLGAIGLANSRREPQRLGIAAARARAGRTQAVFAINLALDVLYVMAGAVMWDQGRVHGSQRLVGWGASVMFQGGFLVAFDAAMVAAHGANLRRARGCCSLTGGPTIGGATLGVRGRF